MPGDDHLPPEPRRVDVEAQDTTTISQTEDTSFAVNDPPPLPVPETSLNVHSKSLLRLPMMAVLGTFLALVIYEIAFDPGTEKGSLEKGIVHWNTSEWRRDHNPLKNPLIIEALQGVAQSVSPTPVVEELSTPQPSSPQPHANTDSTPQENTGTSDDRGGVVSGTRMSNDDDSTSMGDNRDLGGVVTGGRPADKTDTSTDGASTPLVSGATPDGADRESDDRGKESDKSALSMSDNDTSSSVSSGPDASSSHSLKVAAARKIVSKACRRKAQILKCAVQVCSQKRLIGRRADACQIIAGEYTSFCPDCDPGTMTDKAQDKGYVSPLCSRKGKHIERFAYLVYRCEALHKKVSEQRHKGGGKKRKNRKKRKKKKKKKKDQAS